MRQDVAGFAAEIERLTRERDAALAASQARAGFIATTSHEIREPMNGVLGMARLLRDTALDPEQQGYVEAVIEAGETLLTLINDILDLSRIDAGRLPLDEAEFALSPFLERLRTQFEPRAAQKGLSLLTTILPGTPPVLRTDPGRLRQILTNLVGNALKFTEAGRVELRAGPLATAEDRVGLTFEVEDTGPGMGEAALARLFEPYAQAEARTAGLYGGSGLGLAIASRLARLLGGEIAATSREGEGTTCRLSLRLPPPQQARFQGRAGTGSLQGASLLLVDPQERSAVPVRELCSGWGLLVRRARSAAEARALLNEAADRATPFDIVLIDRALPDQPGDRLGADIAADPRQGRPALALLIDSGMRGDAAAAHAAGFAAYLQKPIQAETLLASLQQLREGPRRGGLITTHSLGETRQPSLDILVADDNAMNCRLLSVLLERAGHRLTVVQDGLAAVRALEARAFDLVLMDIQMPVMDGIEATARIRALSDAGRARTPVVAVTANAMRGDDAACLAAGMDGYLPKPITMASLAQAVQLHAAPGGDDRAALLDPRAEPS